MISKNCIDGFNKRWDVVSAFIEHHGEILLLHRQDWKPQGNTWGVPAGKVKGDENLDVALAREIDEEIGLRFSPQQLCYFEGYHVRYPHYDFIYHVFYLLLDATKERPVLRLNLMEHKAYRWLSPAEALRLPLIQDEDFCIKQFYNL